MTSPRCGPGGRHRPSADRPAQPTVRRVLRHLDDVGFAGAPRHLGFDPQDREVRTYLPGEVAGRPWPTWVGDPDRAVSVARLTRQLDDALISLGAPDDVPQERAAAPPSVPAPPAPSFLGRADLTPENTVFQNGVATGFIDFDVTRPTNRLDEVVNLLLWWAAWMPPGGRESSLRDVDAAERGRLLVEGYGLEAQLRSLVVPVSISTAQHSWYRMRDRARRLGGGWARMWDNGVGDRIRRREQWLRAEEARLCAALG